MKCHSHRDGTVRRLLTIEVSNAERTIRQARGKFNARPDHKANDVMGRWCVQAKLSVSKWVI